MKLNSKYGSIIEWIAAIILVIVCLKYSIFCYGSFSPVKAHEQSERTYYYGPSQIIKTIDLDGGKIYLCKYKDWISANTVRKGIIRWYPGDQVSGYPIDYTQKISYHFSGSQIRNNKTVMKIFGYVNDSNISQVIVGVNFNGSIKELNYTLDKNKMFIFYSYDNNFLINFQYIKGIDNQGKILYEKNFPR